MFQTLLFLILLPSPFLAHVTISPDVEPRSAPGVFSCSGPNWTGACTWQEALGQCINTDGSGKPFSLGPDHGVACTLYVQPGCNHNAVAVENLQFPGLAVVDSKDAAFGRTIKAWKCDKK